MKKQVSSLSDLKKSIA